LLAAAGLMTSQLAFLLGYCPNHIHKSARDIDAGRLFVLPTYFFVASFAIILGI
jgi:hypothetical protein